MKKQLSIFFLFVFAFAEAQAQYKFIENGGQWVDNVKFRADIPGGKAYFETDRFTFDLYDVEMSREVFSAHAGNPNPTPPPKYLDCHAFQMVFLNTKAQTKGKKPLTTNYSFFIGNDPEKWAGNLKGYEEVIYENVFEKIDLKVYSNNTLKYDFVVKPGALAKDIQIKYEGVKPKINNKGELEIKTSVGKITETKPFAYQLINGEMKVVECEFVMAKNILSFKTGDYNLEHDLIIDPEMVFSTFSGSLADNFGYSATYDEEGHLYSGSSVFGTGYPVTTGAYQAAWAGGQGQGSNAGTDVAISKFSPDGTSLIYSTYLGGAKDELPHSLIVDENNELYLFGTTASSNFPTTPNAIQSTFAGGESFVPWGIGVAYLNGSDIFVSRLSANGGSLLASTYLGGENNDGLNTSSNLKQNYSDEMRGEIQFDNNGNVLIGTNTFSPDFPTSTNAFQTEKGTAQDGILLRLNKSLTQILNASFFGGNGADAIYAIHTTPDGKITVGGGTTSTNLPSTPNVYQPDYGGGSADGFIAIFDENMESLEAMTYYGSNAYDQIYFVDRNKSNQIVIYGQTRATGTTLIENADYSVPNSGMLLSSFSPDLQNRNWSTVFGNGQNIPNISPSAFAVDICNHIYLSGWGGPIVNGYGGTAGLPITDDALQTTTDNNDFYFMVLSDDASSLVFATYFGGGSSYEHVDGGTSRFDKTGKIYQSACAGCPNNDDWPIYPENAYSATNNSFNCNLGVVKIDFNLPLVFANFNAQPVCLPDAVILENTSSLYSGSNPIYKWIFPNGDTSFDENPNYVFDQPGLHEIKLVVTDPNACNISDTLVKTIEVFPEIALEIPQEITSCTDTSFTITSTTHGASIYYKWATDAAFNNIILEGETDSVLTYNTQQDITLYLHAFNGLCEVTDSVFLSPSPSLSLNLSDTLICATQELDVNVSLSGNAAAATFEWTPGNKIISGQGTQSAVIDASETMWLTINALTEFGCELRDSVQLSVNPIHLEIPNDTLSCYGEPITLTATSNGLAENFQWSNQSDFGIILNPTGDSSITVNPAQLTYYFVKATNGACSLTDSVAVSLLSAGTTITPDRYICSGDTATIVVSNDFPGSQLSHHWQPEEVIVSGQGTSVIRAVVTEPITFFVESTTPEGCVVENSTTIFVSELGTMEVVASADPENIIKGEVTTLTAQPQNDDYHYTWSPSTSISNPNAHSTWASPNSTTTFLLSVMDTNQNGACIRADSVTVYVFESICGEPNIFVPNSFTPNDDGQNDVVWVRGGNISKLKFSIYNRWGEVVFETTDQNKGWDGTFKGKLAEPAVYVYHLNVQCGDGQKYFSKGNITLIR